MQLGLMVIGPRKVLRRVPECLGDADKGVQLRPGPPPPSNFTVHVHKHINDAFV